jgi:hypothetical protein
MKAFLKKILFATLLLVLMISLDACTSSKGGGDEAPEAPAAPPPPQPPPQAEDSPTPANPLLATRWCRAEDWDTFQVVMRMTLKENQIITEYLLLKPSGFDVYQYSEKPRWEMKGQMASEPNKVLVSLHEAPADIPNLPGFPEQKRIFTEVFALNPNLTHPAGDFAPTRAMTTLTRAISTGFEIERNVYPCESYSSTFNEEGPQRPLIELLLLFASNSKGYTADGRGTLASTMKFTFPINEIPVEAQSIADTQWCSWREVGPSELLLRTLTIGQDHFIENAHSQLFASQSDEEDMHNYLNGNASKSENFTMGISGGRLTGRNQTPADHLPRDPMQELFTMVQDSTGLKALVRMDAIEPDRTWPVFSDIYFDCQDARPLQFSPAFQARITEILLLQKAQLQAPTPPAPTPAPAPAPTPGTGTGAGPVP